MQRLAPLTMGYYNIIYYNKIIILTFYSDFAAKSSIL